MKTPGPGTTAPLEIERRRLGRSAVRIPRIALGCGNFGGVGSAPELFGKGLNESRAFELMDAAWELGIRHFDTADAYGGGRSEQAIGRWMRSRGVRPSLTTKTYNPMYEGADRGLAPQRIAGRHASSLERLGVDRIDLYLAHGFDPDTPLTETFDAFESLVAADTVRAYGVSNFTAVQLEAALNAGRPQAIQNAHSLLQREDEEDVIPLAAERDVAYLAYGPLSGGWLTGKYRRGEPFPVRSRMTQRPEPYRALANDDTFATLDRLGAIARERGSSLAGLSLAWLLRDERITQVVIGPGHPQHLEPVREALTAPLTPQERARVQATAFE